MIRIPGKIPIMIHPAFWLLVLIIGFLQGHDLAGVLIWVCLIFISVLCHEFGHAFAAVGFGRKARIELIALGGVTYHDGKSLSLWKQFLITLNGPLFGAGLGLFAAGMDFIVRPPAPWHEILVTVKRVNLFWSLFNLLPVMPLDGGQLLRVICEWISGARGLRYSLLISASIAILLALASLLLQSFLIGSLFFLFAFESLGAWKLMRRLSEQDRKEEIKQLLEKGELLMQQGKQQEALANFEEIRAKAGSSMIGAAATQYLAQLKFQAGDFNEVYKLLLPLRRELPVDSLCLLHAAAFEIEQFKIVAELGAECFQARPNAVLASKNALAAATLRQPEAAVGWLETCLQEGMANLRVVLKNPLFDPIRDDPSFLQFLKAVDASGEPR